VFIRPRIKTALNTTQILVHQFTQRPDFLEALLIHFNDRKEQLNSPTDPTLIYFLVVLHCSHCLQIETIVVRRSGEHSFPIAMSGESWRKRLRASTSK